MRKLQTLLKFFWETAGVVGLALLIIVPVRFFLFQPFFVKGASMEPNFHDGQYLIIDEVSFRLREPARGEGIVFRFPRDTSQFYIKRIIGLPGETLSVRSGSVYIRKGTGTQEPLQEPYLKLQLQTVGDMTVTLGPDEYFVMGDNRGASSDSRRWGALERRYIVGRVLLTLWPLKDFHIFAAPQNSFLNGSLSFTYLR